jgi:hypothetical protein
MARAKFFLKLDITAMNDGDICCTGRQIASLINTLDKSLNWYAADINVNSTTKLLDKYTLRRPTLIGSCSEAVNIINNIDQLLSGILLGVPNDIKKPSWNNRSFFTEDDQYQELGDALVEIRAFDTSCLEIYTSTTKIVDIITENYPLVEKEAASKETAT